MVFGLNLRSQLTASLQDHTVCRLHALATLTQEYHWRVDNMGVTWPVAVEKTITMEGLVNERGGIWRDDTMAMGSDNTQLLCRGYTEAHFGG